MENEHDPVLRELTPKLTWLCTCVRAAEGPEMLQGSYMNPHVKALTDKSMEFIPNADSPTSGLSPTISMELSLPHRKFTRFLHFTKL